MKKLLHLKIFTELKHQHQIPTAMLQNRVDSLPIKEERIITAEKIE